jgi:hypothetical protein
MLKDRSLIILGFGYVQFVSAEAAHHVTTFERHEINGKVVGVEPY